MPTPHKLSTSRASRASAAHSAKGPTRLAANEIRRSTAGSLNALLARRRLQTENQRKELHKNNMARRKAVRNMLADFHDTREENAREMSAWLRSYIDSLQDSVHEAAQETNAMLRQFASKRQSQAAAQARTLARAHQGLIKTQRQHLQDLADARTGATRELQSSLRQFATGLHRDVSAFRQHSHEEHEEHEERGTGEPRHRRIGTPKGRTEPGEKTRAKAAAPKRTTRQASRAAEGVIGARPAARAAKARKGKSAKAMHPAR